MAIFGRAFPIRPWIGKPLAQASSPGSILAGTGVFTLSGVSTLFSTAMPETAGSYSETGVSNTFQTQQPSTVAGYVETGTASVFQVATPETMSSYALTGITDSFRVSFGNSVTPYTLTGLGVTFPTVSAVTGVFTVTGPAVGLNYVSTVNTTWDDMFLVFF